MTSKDALRMTSKDALRMTSKDALRMTSKGLAQNDNWREVMRSIVSYILILICSATAATAQVTDVIRGRITGPDSLPLQGVNVRATSYQGGVAKSTTTDKNGRFT